MRYADAAPDVLVREAADNMSAYDKFRDVREALRWEERAVAAAERSGDHRQLARHLAELSREHLIAGNADAAREGATRARALIGTSGNGRWRTTSRWRTRWCSSTAASTSRPRSPSAS